METLDDTTLMARVQAGRDTACLALLFDRHHRPLYGFLFRLTGQKALSEDLVQEVFLRVLRYAGSFKSGSSFRPWLYRIARNVLADHGTRHRLEVPLESHTDLPAPSECAQAQLEATQDQRRLATAMKCLPREKRELLLLSRKPEFSCADLASLFGCSSGAVKVRVHRALQELRTHFFNMEVR